MFLLNPSQAQCPILWLWSPVPPMSWESVAVMTRLRGRWAMDKSLRGPPWGVNRASLQVTPGVLPEPPRVTCHRLAHRRQRYAGLSLDMRIHLPSNAWVCFLCQHSASHQEYKGKQAVVSNFEDLMWSCGQKDVQVKWRSYGCCGWGMCRVGDQDRFIALGGKIQVRNSMSVLWVDTLSAFYVPNT